MSIINRRSVYRLRLGILLLPVVLVMSACGLAMDTEARLERAGQALADGDYRTAIIDARNILQEDPDNRVARLVLGRAALASGDAATAEKELRRAIELGEELPNVAVDLARALVQLGQFDAILADVPADVARTETDRLAILRLRGDAIMGQGLPGAAREIYLEVLSADSSDTIARLGVARTYAAEGNHELARAEIDEALRNSPNDADAWLASGALRLTIGDAAAARQDLEHALDLAETAGNKNAQLAARVALADAAFAENDLDAAAEQVQRIQDSAPDYIVGWYLSARLAFQRRDFERAQNELQRVLSAVPDYQAAQILMGAVHLERGNLGQAEMHLSPVVAADPDNETARRLLAETRLRQNRASEAAAILDPIMGGAAGTDFDTLGIAVRASLMAGDYDEAIVYLRQALESDPDNQELQLDLAAAYLSAGDIASAEGLLAALQEDSGEVGYRRAILDVMALMRRGDETTALERALSLQERWPQDARVHNLIGGIALGMDRFELADQNFRAAQQLAPSEATGYVNLAQLAMRRGDIDTAREQLEAAIRQQPGSSSLKVLVARLEAIAGNRDAALGWLEKARAADPTSLAASLLLARVYLDQREYEKAREVAEEAVTSAPENVEALNVLGLAEQGVGNITAASARFDRALELDPDNADYRVNAAQAQLRLGNAAVAEKRLGSDVNPASMREAVLLAGIKAKRGDMDGAKAIARELQRQHPDNGIPFALEAEFLANQREFGAASALYDRALTLMPEDRSLVLRAYAVRNRGKLADATRPIEDYLDRHPMDVDARIWLAEAQRLGGIRDGAKANYLRVLDTDPNHLMALNNLAWMYYEDGDSGAEELAQRAYDLAPDNGNVADTLGWIQVSDGRLDAGIATLRKAVTLTSGSAETQYHLGVALAKKGETAEAREVLEQALAGDRQFNSRTEAEALLESL